MLLNAALNYLRNGLSVIPLEPRGKRPLIPWTEFQSRRASESEVKGWFLKWPDANIGIVTGLISQVAIVDLDGPEGLTSASTLGLKTTVTSISGKGKHLWFKNSADISNAVRLLPGLDLRATGGYVVAPPSLHENGNRYRWLRPLTAGMLSTLPEFPLHLLKPNAPALGTLADVTARKPPLDVAAALKEMTNGNIDITLFRICSKLRNDNWTADDARILLEPHAIRAGATPGHLEDKINNVWSRYSPREVVAAWPNQATNQRTFTGPAVGSSPLFHDNRDSSTVQVENAETLEDFLKEEDKVEWIVPGLVAEAGFAFVVGLPETNKTWALIDLAIEASRGGLWMGALQTKKQKVLFIDQERFQGETKRRIRALLAAKGLSARDLPNLEVKCGTTIKIDLDASYAAFRKKLAADKPTLVIVDSLATFHTKEENNRQAIQDVLERIKSLRNEFKCTFVFIHHENKASYQAKAEGREPSLAEMAGNIAIPAAAETVFQVRKRVDGSSLFYHTKSTVSRTHAPFEVQVNDLGGPDKIQVKAFL